MTSAALRAPARASAEWLFVLAAFCGAAMVFMVEPMVAKLVLPQLGGSPAVWNTSLAFFQIALLVGYGYAHLLQRLKSIRLQAAVHIAVLMLAALALPLRVTPLLGDPWVNAPTLWLLGVLTISLGAPFAALSATAPLVQAWHARTFRRDGAAAPWALYAASNFGSLLALLAYPVIVEPLTRVTEQRLAWSLAYVAFVAIMAVLALRLRSDAPGPVVEQAAPVAPTAPVTWRNRLIWIGLAAIPSSMMLGVTAHLTTDVASAPFLWVVPLALYLITFIIAFQDRPAIKPALALILQGMALPLCLAIFYASQVETLLAVHLGCFFLTALVCHQTLVARRPDAAHLTEFYLCLSVGGVVGGAFNAFLAPVIFNTVVEYPLVLVLSCLARPFGDGRPTRKDWILVGASLAFAITAAVVAVFVDGAVVPRMLLAGAAACAFLLRDRALIFLVVIGALAVTSNHVSDRADNIRVDRSFFGVVRQIRRDVPGIGELRIMAHGTTIHGAQAQAPGLRCRPLVYYAPETPIGQIFTRTQRERPAIRVAAVGLGTGSVAAYVRPNDRLTFFEIDPLVIRLASDPAMFSYTSQCAKGPVNFVLGDARLTLAKQPTDAFDILLIDAFSSDAVPAHLLTVEAMRGYLTHIKPDGVVILHLSNRNLDLLSPAMAVASAAGGHALLQRHDSNKSSPDLWEASEHALVVARSEAALAAYARDPRWSPSDPTQARAWTDDYTNLLGAYVRRIKVRWSKK